MSRAALVDFAWPYPGLDDGQSFRRLSTAVELLLNPFVDCIQSGMTVTVLPNHVAARREKESADDFDAKITHPSVLLAAILVVRARVGPTGRIIVGNSPLQGQDYTLLRKDCGVVAIADFLRTEGILNVEFVDLRAFTSVWRNGALISQTVNPDTEVVRVDLGAESYLDPLSIAGAKFRVGDYSPDATRKYHSPGMHWYAITRSVLDSDAIVSVPKLKTHQKVGLTCTLKGAVGTVALKECLAHHSSPSGPQGDEFPGSAALRNITSQALEYADNLRGGQVSNLVRFPAKVANRLLSKGDGAVMGGAWAGNDTAWRMSLDLCRILRFADSNGRLHETERRPHISLIDGIVAGEGNGPLRPVARTVGLLIAGGDPVVADEAACRAAGFLPALLPIVREARLRTGPFPLISLKVPAEVTLSDAAQSIVEQMSIRPLVAPKGWTAGLGNAFQAASA